MRGKKTFSPDVFFKKNIPVDRKSASGFLCRPANRIKTPAEGPHDRSRLPARPDPRAVTAPVRVPVPADLSGRLGDPDALVRLESVAKTYTARRGAGAVTALEDIDLSVSRGRVLGVIGRSGAGKSTLIRLVNGLERPSRGRVIVDRAEISSLSESALRAERRGIGMIFQHFNLLSARTAAGNVALPLEVAGADKRAIRARVAELLDLVGLGPQADRYPAELSGGQKQRVGIARALATNPKVLLSDEATSALDPETTRSILDLLGRINRDLGLTILLITHEMAVIRAIADEVAVLDGGRIAEKGDVFEVFTRPQAAITRTFLDEETGRTLPPALAGRLSPGLTAGEGKQAVLRITFRGPHATDPVWRSSPATPASRPASSPAPSTRSPAAPSAPWWSGFPPSPQSSNGRRPSSPPAASTSRCWAPSTSPAGSRPPRPASRIPLGPIRVMSPELTRLLVQATIDTLQMVAVAASLGTLVGLPLGVFLATSGRGELLAAPWLNRVLGLVVNATRSTPFIILVVAIIPFTRLVAGTSIGTNAATVPLTIAAIPFIARLVEGAVREVDGGLVEAARAFGASPLQIVLKVLIPEALPGIVLGLTLAVVSLIGFSAMVGAVGGGGLGDLGIRYGYQRFMPEMMLAVVVVLIVLVQLVQTLGDRLARRMNKRLRHG